MGEFQPDAQVKGVFGCNLTALTCNKNSATFRALSLFTIIAAQMYEVFIDDRKVIFSQKKGVINYNGELVNSDDLWTRVVKPKVSQSPPRSIVIIELDDLSTQFEQIFNGHDKINAAGGIVEVENHFLMIRRHDLWDIPKGKVDEGETMEEAAIREVEEECGLNNIILGNLICETHHTYSYHGIPTLKRTLWFSMKIESLQEGTPQLEEGISELKWFTLEELKMVKDQTYTSIAFVLEQFFKTKK